MKTALLVIDYINGIIENGSCKQWSQSHPVVQNTNRIIKQSRKVGIPIYFIRLAFDTKYSNLPKHSKMFNRIKEGKRFQLGHNDVGFVKTLNFNNNDIIINKTGSSPFVGNDLQEQLEGLSIEHLIFTGVATDNAISSGVRYAHDLGFYTSIVEDACGAHNEALHNSAISLLAKVANVILSTENCLENLHGYPL